MKLLMFFLYKESASGQHLAKVYVSVIILICNQPVKLWDKCFVAVFISREIIVFPITLQKDIHNLTIKSISNCIEHKMEILFSNN